MSTDYIKAIVRQTIPADCLAPIERWLLTRIFETEERGDSLVFYGSWDYSTVFDAYGVSPDDKLTEALTASREICPELCAEVERLSIKARKARNFGSMMRESFNLLCGDIQTFFIMSVSKTLIATRGRGSIVKL